MSPTNPPADFAEIEYSTMNKRGGENHIWRTTPGGENHIWNKIIPGGENHIWNKIIPGGENHIWSSNDVLKKTMPKFN